MDDGCDPRFARAQTGCQESLNALLRQHDGLVQAAVRRQVTGSRPAWGAVRRPRRHFRHSRRPAGAW